MRAIEIGFPIVEINRLAVPERNSFKPIYQMHKWFARRASCVFRAILLGALKPAFGSDGKPTDLMEEFYKDHTTDPDTAGKVILDPFMGGGTTVVEALRLGCRVIGIDLNPVAWFIVKTEIEPVDLEELQAVFERLAERPVDWNGGRPLRDTLLGLYKTEVCPGIEADIIYTFWVKHAVCTDQNCRGEVPLFNNYIIAQKSVSVPYYRDVSCPHCAATYDWDLEVASLIADPAMMVNAPRGSSGEGRPSAIWSYAQPSAKRSTEPSSVECPHCRLEGHPRLSETKKLRKKVPLTVLLCPACQAVWQWRGILPQGEVCCAACRHCYDPLKGNIPEKGKFICPQCGAKDKIIQSLRMLPKDCRLPIRPYALQAYLAPRTVPPLEQQSTLFGRRASEKPAASSGTLCGSQLPGLLLPKNGKFFTRFTSSDQARLIEVEKLWDQQKERVSYPKSAIPIGEKTKSGLLAHHYNYWHEMFAPRQLLALSTLLRGIMIERDQTLREALLCAFSNTLEGNNLFVRNIPSRSTPGGTAPAGVFARHDFQPKMTSCEQNAWGTVSGNNTFVSRMELLKEGIDFRGKWSNGGRECVDWLVSSSNATINSVGAQEGMSNLRTPVCHIVTDPPYVGNVNYAELADFFYVWLRLALKNSYGEFSPEYTPKREEIIKNAARGKSQADFYADLSAVFAGINRTLSDGGLLVFTFHHTDQEGTVWEGLLASLCQEGFEIVAVYPIHGEREASLHLLDKENVSYDLIHVCRKRKGNPQTRSWAGIRQEVRRRARDELKAIEEGRYGKEPLPSADVRLICIGKCLELFSAHYGCVVDHQGRPVSLHGALADIGTIVDQLVTRDRPLPPELEGAGAISYAWLRLLRKTQREVQVDELNKGLRAMQVTADDLKQAGLIIRGRTGRGRTYEVKQPHERLNSLLEKLKSPMPEAVQRRLLFDETGDPVIYDVSLVDLVHLLLGLAKAGESVSPWLERFSQRRPQLRAALSFLRDERPDWVEIIDRILPIIESKPLLRAGERD